jgi:hypothetical protein
MDSASISALAALSGSVVGGLTSLVATWVSQNAQARTQVFIERRTRRQQLYQTFIEDASRLYAQALTSDQAEIGDLVSLYAMIARMRMLSTPAVVSHAEAVVGTIIVRSPSRRRPFAICGRSSTASGSIRFAISPTPAAGICGDHAWIEALAHDDWPCLEIAGQAWGYFNQYDWVANDREQPRLTA